MGVKRAEERLYASFKRGQDYLDRMINSPSCAYAGGRIVVLDEGVFFEGVNKDGDPLPSFWICSRLDILAKTRSGKSEDWGRLLQWRDDAGFTHRWAMPMSMLQGDGVEVFRELARRGLLIAPGKRARELLSAYLQIWPVRDMARCENRIGWQGGAFVLPDEVIGDTQETIVFQSESVAEPGFSRRGSVEDWRKHVGEKLSGNSRLVFAASCAFAGPLLGLVGEEGGGFHFRGASSTGKSTALRVAASVWGGQDYMRNWRATANGIEGAALSHNDGTLILDEIGQCDPKVVGEVAYLLANGQGKQRASRSGAARPVSRWRLLLLSSGEESLSALAAKAGYRTTAGQEVRLADIDADAGKGMGIFEHIHGAQSPAAFSVSLKEATDMFYGSVGRAWLEVVISNRPRFSEAIAQVISKFMDLAGAGASGQVMRVARRFGIVAAAGELATSSGLTGWTKGEAICASRACFLAWLDAFGDALTCHEDRTILSQVQAFIEAHGDSRFQRLDRDDNYPVRDRVGFSRIRGDQTEYLFLPEAFRKDVCKGYDVKTVVRVLSDAGWLVHGSERATRSERISGHGVVRVYVIRPALGDDSGISLAGSGVSRQDVEDEIPF